MDTNETSTPEGRMRERKEHPVLCMQREEGEKTFRYLVGVTDQKPHRYSVYAEYRDAERHTVGEVADFSTDRDMAEGFCSMLDRFSITPLSLHAIYEDHYTP